MRMATIGLLGDVMLGRGVAEALTSTPPEELWASDIRALAGECDAVVCNLECCISAHGIRTRAIPGKPFFFRAPPVATDSLRAVNVRVASLANNHALDFGEEALADTLGHLRDAEIEPVGAGAEEAAARAGAVVRAGSIRLGVVAVSDHPAEYAVPPRVPGIAYADLRDGSPDWLLAELARLREDCDAVIAFPHWGPNMTTQPAFWQHRRVTELLDAGAGLIAGHSAHVFHGAERLAGGIALYDLGDALDDYAVDPRLRNDLGVFAIWRPGGTPEIEIAGLRLEYCHTRLASGADAEWIAQRLGGACADLGTRVERLDEARFAI
jgi:poly-gamma-glutamate capsule biosynthesis protein CapA/YwtB (metallophosphatase superfamily)